MPAPSEATFSLQSKIDAQTSFRDLIDSGSGPGLVRLLNAADVLLAEITLDDPCGSVSGSTGQLTFSIPGPDPSANADGVCAYGEILDSDENVHLALPAQQGSAPVVGKLVMNTTQIFAGQPVTIVSITVG